MQGKLFFQQKLGGINVGIISQSLPSKAILSVKNRPTFDTQNSEELGAEDSEAEGALLEVESALVEVEDALLEVESALVEVDGALLEVENA